MSKCVECDKIIRGKDPDRCDDCILHLEGLDTRFEDMVVLENRSRLEQKVG